MSNLEHTMELPLESPLWAREARVVSIVPLRGERHIVSQKVVPRRESCSPLTPLGAPAACARLSG